MADEVTEGTDAGVEPTEPIEGSGANEGGVGDGATGSETEEPTYLVKVDGREVSVTHDELLNGYMRQADYTRKTQSLSEQRQAVSQMEALSQALERDPHGTLVALAGALGVNFGSGQATGEAEELEPWEQVSREVQSLKGEFQSQRQAEVARQTQAQQAAAAEARIVQETADLKSMYGDFPERELYQYAVAVNAQDLHTAYRAWQFDKQQEARMAEHNRTVASKRQAQVVNGGHTSSAAATASDNAGKRLSVREAFQAAVAAQGS